MASRRCGWMVCLLASVSAYPATLPITFASRGVSLSGSLELPEGQPIRSAVVFIHGSGPQTRNLGLAERFADSGIAAVVYDKRGVGQSGGEYEGHQSVSEQNISLLADDALAALHELVRQV